MNVELVSTGGTFSVLQGQGIDVVQVSDVTGFPEILNGRVKTLHPKIHGGLLGVLDNEEHVRQLEEHHIPSIDLVVVNLYPFERTIAQEGVSMDEAVEQIDIGGPTMLRAAAKNFKHKAVVVNPDSYESILKEMHENDCTLCADTCFALAREVFRHTSSYDAAISRYLDGRVKGDEFPDRFSLQLSKEQDLRYGENPHQQAALYGTFGSLFTKLHGKELSYNNIVDLSAAALLVAEFEEPTVVIIKHTNPCGVASAKTLEEAYAKALATDRASAFGGIIAVNRSLDHKTAEAMNEIFTELIIAPDFSDDVLAFLAKKKDRRLIRSSATTRQWLGHDIKSVPGGILLQTSDGVGEEQFKVVSRREPTEQEMKSMRFAWLVAKHVKSNAIVYALSDRTVGVGAGQMSRVDSARIASMKARAAGLETKGTAVASDAFFPFADGLLEVAAAGSTAVIQPGGSVRDQEVIAAADEHNLAMIFTGTRHFRH